MWSSHPSEWRTLCQLWLRVEGSLAKTGLPDLTHPEIKDLTVPPDVLNWMINRQLSQEHPPPDDGFAKVWTTFLSQLAVSDWETSDILQEMWCRPGPTGIVFLLLGTHWQAEYCGTGKSWHQNVKRVGSIFNIILSHPALYVVPLSTRYIFLHVCFQAASKAPANRYHSCSRLIKAVSTLGATFPYRNSLGY